jgi:hypothetical protein
MLHLGYLLFLSVLFLIVIMGYIARKRSGHFLDKFTNKFAIIGSIFVPVGIYLTYQVFSLQLQAMSRDATYKIIDRGWLDVNKKMVEYYDKCPNFVNSLYFDWQKKVLGQESSPTKQDDWYAVNYLSIIIFQSWEDFITSSTVDETGIIVWINNFLQWSNSELLRNNWSVLKSNYAATTQEFGDYLFYVSSMYKPKNESELENLSKMVAESEKIKNIISHRFNH